MAAVNGTGALWPHDVCFICETILVTPDETDNASTDAGGAQAQHKRVKRYHRTVVSQQSGATDRAKKYAAVVAKEGHAKQVGLVEMNKDLIVYICAKCYAHGDIKAATGSTNTGATRRLEAHDDSEIATLEETQPPPDPEWPSPEMPTLGELGELFVDSFAPETLNAAVGWGKENVVPTLNAKNGGAAAPQPRATAGRTTASPATVAPVLPQVQVYITVKGADGTESPQRAVGCCPPGLGADAAPCRVPRRCLTLPAPRASRRWALRRWP